MEFGLVGYARSVLRKFYQVSPTSYIWASVTKLHRTWIHNVTGQLRGKLLLDIVGGIVEDYDYLWDEYYFSTATV